MRIHEPVTQRQFDLSAASQQRAGSLAMAFHLVH